MVPPLIVCRHVTNPHAKALIGTYEFYGVVDGRPAYRQSGICSQNILWYSEHLLEGPAWVITRKSDGVGAAPSSVIARTFSTARWPWETDAWMVCGSLDGKFSKAPKMKFALLITVAELVLKMSIAGGAKGDVAETRYRLCGRIGDKPAFREVGAGPEKDGLRLFFMEKSGRWMVASVRTGGGGIESLVARSAPDDGSTWASLWPWAAEPESWEVATGPMDGLDPLLQDKWIEDRYMQIKLVSPKIRVTNLPACRATLKGIFQPRGMANNRSYYVQNLGEDASAGFVDPVCLWYAEDRGQWVFTDTSRLGNSSEVYARITSRAWWPWEAHLAGNTSPASVGAVPFAAAPPWHAGQAMLKTLSTHWEAADATGAFCEATDVNGTSMSVDLIVEPRVKISSALAACTHAFLGIYEFTGIMSARPYYVQMAQAPRYVIWYSEEFEQWTICIDYRLGETGTVAARCDDSSWFPWETDCPWEVPDGAGDFAGDPLLSIAPTKELPPSPDDATEGADL